MFLKSVFHSCSRSPVSSVGGRSVLHVCVKHSIILLVSNQSPEECGTDGIFIHLNKQSCIVRLVESGFLNEEAKTNIQLVN